LEKTPLSPLGVNLQKGGKYEENCAHRIDALRLKFSSKTFSYEDAKLFGGFIMSYGDSLGLNQIRIHVGVDRKWVD
jgi:hypothetical protein